ncbi:MAG: hypothetical protein WC840_01785 [Candidatus Peribacteraceae bacterium]
MEQKSKSKKQQLPGMIAAGNREIATWLYDQLMSQVNPALVTTNLQNMEADWKRMTDEQKREKSKELKAAFAEYDRRSKQRETSILAALAGVRRKASRSAEADTAAEEQAAMQSMEDIFQS